MKQKLIYNPLAMKAIAVAVINQKEESEEIYDWAVYIDAVPGESHKKETKKVADEGVKQNRKIAEVLFPNLPIKKYRN